MKRTTLLYCGVLGVWCLLFGACSDVEPVKVGYVGSITGRYSELGVTARNTIQLMTEEFNAAGGLNGRPLTVVNIDDGGSPEGAKAALQNLINDEVKLIVGPLTSNMAEATIEAVEGHNVLLMTPSMSTDYLGGRDDTILRTSGTNSAQAKLMADTMMVQGKKNVAVIYDLGNKKYTEGLFNAFREYAAANSLEIVFEKAYTSGPEVDFVTMVSDIIDSGADSVLCIISGLDGAPFAQQLRKVDTEIALYGVSWTQSNDLIRNGGKAVEGMHLVGLYDYGKLDPVIEDLRGRYQRRFNTEPSFIYTRVYDGYSILLDGLLQVGKPDPVAIKRVILETKKYKGLGRTIEFDQYGDTVAQLKLVRVHGAEFKDVD